MLQFGKDQIEILAQYMLQRTIHATL